MTEFLAQTGSWWASWLPVAVMLLMLGLVFLIVEIVTVSFGVLSLMALGCFVGCLVVAFGRGPTQGFTFLVLIVVLAPATVITFLKLLPNTRFGHRLITRNPRPEEVTATGEETGVRKLAGQKGRAVTRCRPAGIAEIGGRRVDVVTEGVMVDAGDQVEVVGVEGNRVIVRKVQTEV